MVSNSALRRKESEIVEIPSPLPDSNSYRMGRCTIIVDRVPRNGRQEWHLSIAHPARYPIWDEIVAARYALLPNEARMAMILPPVEEYVNVHENCFHLWEIFDE